MPNPLSTLQVLCRPAQEHDLEDIREFCRTIWEGHDYVPDAVEDWLHDSQGLLAVAGYEGHAIGCSKLTRLAKDQWWLEGFRVDPKYQGLKVGSRIHHYVNRWWLEHASGVLRLMTSAKNKTVHHLCESTGFEKLFEVRGYKAEPINGNADAFLPAVSNPQDLKKVIEYARESPSLAITNFIVDFGWRVVDPTLGGAIASLYPDPSSHGNKFFWWHRDQGLLIVWDDYDPDQDQFVMGLGVIACKLRDLPELLMDVRYLAARQGKTSIFWLAPVYEHFEAALHRAGYTHDWDNTAYIFEKAHPQHTP